MKTKLDCTTTSITLKIVVI